MAMELFCMVGTDAILANDTIVFFHYSESESQVTWHRHFVKGIYITVERHEVCRTWVVSQFLALRQAKPRPCNFEAARLQDLGRFIAADS